MVRGLGWRNGELYLVGGPDGEQDGIYALDTGTWTATRVARMVDFGVGYRTLTAVTSRDGLLYVASSHGGTGRLFRIDLQEGTIAQLGRNNLGAVGENAPAGLAFHNDKLYVVGATTDRLYEIHPVSGHVRAVGSAHMFNAPGGGEDSPSGLVSDGNDLYMTGDDKDLLYRLDIATGVAAPVSSLTGFGISEGSPQGIAGIRIQPSDYEIDSSTGAITYTGGPAAAGKRVLYALVSDGRDSEGGTSHAVDDITTVTVTLENRTPAFIKRSYSYTLTFGGNSSNGNNGSNKGSNDSNDPVAVGTPLATDPDGQPLVYNLYAQDPPERMYMVSDTKNALYALDSTTGAATARVGTASRFGVNETGPRGLAWHDGQLYMTGSTANSLYTLDIVTGEATRVASSDSSLGTLLGVASHRGELYVTTGVHDADSSGRLYRVDLDTSAFIQIGGADFGVGETHPRGMASHGSPAELYMLGNRNDALYTLNTDTGEAAQVGSNHRFGIGEYDPAGLTSHAGSLYMTGNANDTLYTLDTDTGEAAQVGSNHRFGIGEHWPSGIATGYHAFEGFIIDKATGEISYTGVSAAYGMHIFYVQVSDGANSSGVADDVVDDIARVVVTVPD